MRAPLHNNIAAVAPEPFYHASMPRLQLAARILLAVVAAAYLWQLPPGLPLLSRQAFAAGALGYVLAQALISLLSPRLPDARWGLLLGANLLDLLGALVLLCNDPAPCPPSALLLVAALGLLVGQQRWPGSALLTGVTLLLGAAALTLRQHLLQLPPDGSYFMLLLFLVITGCILLLLARQIEQLHVRTAQVTELDTLTGLGNRWTFYEAAKYLLPYRERNLIPMVVMLADIELTAEQPPRLNRALREQLVRQFAAISEQRLRTSDVAAYYGGTAFAYLLIDTTIQDAEAIANDLQRLFDQWASSNGLPARAFVGMASVPQEAVALDQVLINISAAMQRARQYKRGVTATVFADPEHQG